MTTFKEWQEEYKQHLANLTELRDKVLDDVAELQSEQWLEDAEWEETTPLYAVQTDLTYWD